MCGKNRVPQVSEKETKHLELSVKKTKHLKTNWTSYQFYLCLNALPEIQIFNGLYLKTGAMYECMECMVRFQNSDKLLQHIDNHKYLNKKNDDKGQSPFKN